MNGVIAPDLPLEEAALCKETASRNGLDTIFLAAPSTSAARLEKLLNASSGFLYLVSANGVTGARETVQDESIAFIKRTASFVKGRAPLAVGFGLSLPSHVQQVIDNGANAAVVGSRFAQIVEQNLEDRQDAKNAAPVRSGAKEKHFAERSQHPFNEPYLTRRSLNSPTDAFKRAQGISPVDGNRGVSKLW